MRRGCKAANSFSLKQDLFSITIAGTDCFATACRAAGRHVASPPALEPRRGQLPKGPHAARRRMALQSGGKTDGGPADAACRARGS